MNIRTFFKLYSIPFSIVLVGLGTYAGIVVLMGHKDFAVNKRISSREHSSEQNRSIHITQGSEVGILKSDSSSQSEPLDPVDGHKEIQAETQTPNSVDISNEGNEATGIDEISSHTNQQTLDSKDYLYAKYRANIRRDPDKDAPIIAKADVGERLELKSREEDWVRVRNSFGIEGYVAAFLLSDGVQEMGEAYTILPQALNVRLAPDRESTIIGRFTHKTRIYVLEQEGEWGKVQLPNKQYGYISMQHILKVP